MGIFNNNKETNKKIEKLDEKVNQVITLMSEPFEPLATTNRKVEILENETKMEITGQDILKSIGVNKSGLNYATLTQIYNNVIPSKLTWDYWIAINQWANRRVGRYLDFDHEHKKEIIQALKIAILYGCSGIVKETFQPVYVTPPTKIGQTKLKCYPISVMYSQSNIAVKNSNIDIKGEGKEIDEKDLFIFTWRDGYIGDFVWCLKPILIDLYIKKIAECNTSHLVNKVWLKVKNPNTLKTELEINTDPTLPFGVIITDEGAGEISGANNLYDKNYTIENSHLEQIIMAHKYHKEDYYNTHGIQITSSKNQSLSSDANLSVNNTEQIARYHDEMLRPTFEDMGIDFNPEMIEEEDLEPQNENADKEGEGLANTNGERLKEGE